MKLMKGILIFRRLLTRIGTSEVVPVQSAVILQKHVKC